jgi:hypothetical protein
MEECVVISKIEILTAAKEYPNVGVAFENAVNSCIKYASEAKRYDGKPGLWGRAKLARVQFNYARSLSEVLTNYRNATCFARPTSDLESLTTTIIDEAEFRMLPEEARHRWISAI